MNKEIILEEKDGQTEFDVILVGTGIVESILSCSLSRAGKKILHLDANRFYGSNFASLNLKQYNSYIQGKLDELPSFRSNGKLNDQHSISLDEIKSIVNDQNVQFRPISFLNSLTSKQNVFGNFDQIDHTNDYKKTFKEFEHNVLQKRYKIKYQIGYTFCMKDKNELLVYKIINILSTHDIYECQRVFINKNKSDFPLTIHLHIDQLSHTKKYIPKPPRNTTIFKLNDVLYYKCYDNDKNQDVVTNTDDKMDNTENNDNNNNETDKNDKNEKKGSNDNDKADKSEEDAIDNDINCVCKAIMDENKEIMFYEYENEIDCIIGMTFELKKILYEIVDISNDYKILCKLVSQKSLYGQSNTTDIMISFDMEQIKDFSWIKPRKRYRPNINSILDSKSEEEWDSNTDYKDDVEWDKLIHLRQIFKSYDKQYRKICIDFIPNLIYSIESFIEVLIRSKVSTYVDFRGINKNFVYSDNLSILKVPLSRSDVFTTKALTFLEKRQLTKFMQGVLNDTFDENGSNAIENDIKFSKYMSSQNVSSKLSNFIRYALAFLDSPSQDPTAKDMLYRLRLFLKSIGRFSSGSFLYPLYGCGDLAPGFVRSSAVKGGVFILDWCPKAIIIQNIKYHNMWKKKGFVFYCIEEKMFYVIIETIMEEKKYKCLCLMDKTIKLWDMKELERLYEEKKIFALIGKRFIMENDGYKYEVIEMKIVDDNNIIIRCLLSPQITLIPEMHDIAKCIYLDLMQLLYVKWIDIDNEIKMDDDDDDDDEKKEENDDNNNDNDEDVMRCTGIITASNQFIKTRYFVGAADYFKDTIESVSVKHCRMTVISDGPIVGTLVTMNNNHNDDDDDDDDDDSDDSDDDEDDDNDNNNNNNNNKQTVNEKSNCCVVHIPPNTKPFDNKYSIHIIQLDHYSCTVPPPLCLTFFWMQCGDDIENAKQSLKKCYNIFYRKDVIVKNEDDKKPLGLMRTIYEQRIRKVNTNKFTKNVFIVKDLSDTIGYQNAVQSAKHLFNKMFPNDIWMEKDKIIKPKQTRADKVFGALKDGDKEKDKNQNENTETNKQETSNDQTKNTDNDNPPPTK